jgi:hypothetical protein
VSTKDQRTINMVHYPLADDSDPRDLSEYLDDIDAAVAANVVGPASATDNAVALFNGTTGKIVKNSAVIVNAGAVSGITTLATTGAITQNSVSVATLNTNTWAQQQGFAQASLTDASTISWNCQTQQSAYVLLTSGVGGTRALGAATNQVAGFTYILRVQQSSGGSNALTYDSTYKFPGGVDPVLSTAANAIDVLTFVSDGTNMYGAVQKAFA